MNGEPLQKVVAGEATEDAFAVIERVGLLPDEMQKAIRELLVQGATIEGAAQTVNQRRYHAAPAEKDGKPGCYQVTPESVRDYYNADRELQRERAHYLVDGTETITRSLSRTGDLNEGEARYVQAVVMTGLARINDSDVPLSVKEALRARTEMGMLGLKIRLGKLKAREILWRRAYEKSQKALLDQKKEFVFEQTVKLRDMMRKLKKKKSLTPETMQRIRDTYGLLAENVAQATRDLGASEPEASLAASMAEEEAIEPEPLFFAREEEVLNPTVEMKKNIEEQLRSGEEEGEF